MTIYYVTSCWYVNLKMLYFIFRIYCVHSLLFNFFTNFLIKLWITNKKKLHFKCKTIEILPKNAFKITLIQFFNSAITFILYFFLHFHVQIEIQFEQKKLTAHFIFSPFFFLVFVQFFFFYCNEWNSFNWWHILLGAWRLCYEFTFFFVTKLNFIVKKNLFFFFVKNIIIIFWSVGYNLIKMGALGSN